MSEIARSKWSELNTFANRLTMARILLVPVFVACFLSASWGLRVVGLGVYILAAITDWWDGHYARKNHTITATGKFLDPLADKLLTTAGMLAVAYELRSVAMLAMALVIVARDLSLTLLRVRASRRGQVFETSWLAKLKTWVQLVEISTIITVWTAYTIGLEFGVCTDCIARTTLATIFNVTIALTAALAVISGGQYMMASKEEKRAE